MSDDGFVELAAQSARVRNEHRLLLQGLKSFEQKLVELVEGLGCGGNSKTLRFSEYTDAEGDKTRGCRSVSNSHRYQRTHSGGEAAPY